MARGEDQTPLDQLMSSRTGPCDPVDGPPGTVLIITSVIGLAVCVAVIPRLVYWLFPLPWDLVMWFLGR